MTWTYSGNPASSTLDAVRFTVGDTDTTDQLVSDEEILYMINTYGTIFRISSEVCRAIAAKYAKLIDRTIGGLSANFADKYHHYLELADSLVEKDELLPVSPFISGFSRSRKESVELDNDRESTFGRKGQHDNPRSYPVDDSPAGYRRS